MEREPFDYDATYLLWSSTSGDSSGKIWFDKETNRAKTEPESLLEEIQDLASRTRFSDGAEFFEEIVRSGNAYSFFVKEESVKDFMKEKSDKGAKDR